MCLAVTNARKSFYEKKTLGSVLKKVRDVWIWLPQKKISGKPKQMSKERESESCLLNLRLSKSLQLKRIMHKRMLRPMRQTISIHFRCYRHLSTIDPIASDTESYWNICFDGCGETVIQFWKDHYSCTVESGLCW